jgi:hypothetical protein
MGGSAPRGGRRETRAAQRVESPGIARQRTLARVSAGQMRLAAVRFDAHATWVRFSLSRKT